MIFSDIEVFIAFAAGFGLAVIILFTIFYFQLNKLGKDYLTGLHSYRSLLNYMKRHKKGKYVFVLIDIDDFRRFNIESYEKGDYTISVFAEALFHRFSSKAKVFRYKLGDEFVLIVPAKYNLDLQEDLSAFNASQTTGFTWACIEYSAKTDEIQHVLQKAGEKLLQKKAVQ